MKISLRDIEVGDLNNVCIMIISKFSRVLHELDGTVLKLRDPNVLLEIAKHANAKKSPQLEILYQRLKLELRKELNSSVPTHGEIGSLLVQPDLIDRIKRRAQTKNIRKSRL